MKYWPEPAHKSIGNLVILALFSGLALVGEVSRAQIAPGGDVSEATFRRVSNRLLCQCGCNYMVLSCNHLDCPSATYIRKTIKTSLAEGKSEDAIVASFVEQYGVRILPEPPRRGFSLTAWVMPFAALLLGGGAVSYVLWQWKGKPKARELAGKPPESAAPPDSELQPALVEKYRAQIDRELEED